MSVQPTPVTPEVAAVETLVADWGRRLVRRWTLGRAVAACAILALLLLGTVVADHYWPGGLPRGVLRAVALGCGAGIALFAAGLLVIGRLKRPNPLFAGQQLERALAIPHNALINTLALHRTPDGAYVLDAAARQATRALRSVGELPSPPAALGTGVRRVLLVVAALWVLYAVLAPKSVVQSLLRLAGFDLAPPTATQLELIHPAAGQVARAGEPLDVEFAVRGRTVDDVRLSLADAGGGGVDTSQRTIQLARAADVEGSARWAAVLAPHEVMRDIRFVCCAGDATLRGVIRVAPRPEIEALCITLRPPDGYGDSVMTTERDLTVLPGTQATFELTANTPLRDPVFAFRGEAESKGARPLEQRTRMSVATDDPRVARSSMVLSEAGEYRIEFSDEWNTPYRDPHWYRISMREGVVGNGNRSATSQGGAAAGGEGGEATGGDDSGENGEGSNRSSGSTKRGDEGGPGHAGDRPGGANDSGTEGNKPSTGEGGGNPSKDRGEGNAGKSGSGESEDAGGDQQDGNPQDEGGESSSGSGSDSDAPPGESRGAGRRDGSPASDTMPPADPRDDTGPRGPGDAGDGEPEHGGGPSPNPGLGRSAPMNIAEMLARGMTIPESALMDLGLSPEAARSFAGELRRAQEAARRFGVTTPQATAIRGRTGDATAERGRGLANDAQRGVAGADAGLRQALGRITPPPNQSVPPQLRAVLEAYYRSLAARRGE